MSLVYLIAGLPTLKESQKPAISKRELINKIYKSELPNLMNELDILILSEKIEDANKQLLDEKIEHKNKRLEQLLTIIFSEQQDNPWTSFFNRQTKKLLHFGDYHNLKRRWYEFAQGNSRSYVLKNWLSFSLDFEEVLAGLLCKNIKLPKKQFLKELAGGSKETAFLIGKNYNNPDLGIKKRFPWYEALNKALAVSNLEAMERKLNKIRWKVLSNLEPTDVFSLDFVIVYYLQLCILEREQQFNPDVGKGLLADIYRPITEEIL